MLAERRYLALVLPELLLEWAHLEDVRGGGEAEVRGRAASGQRATPRPRVVVLSEHEEQASASAPLAALDRCAHSLGLRVGHSLAEALLLVSSLEVRVLPRPRLRSLLGSLSEILLSYGPAIGFQLPDTLWVEVTGCAHLFGGEAELVAAVRQRFAELGHRVRYAVAPGPRLAQALARWDDSKAPLLAISAGEEARCAMARLPLQALPLSEEQRTWLVRLGVVTVGQLRQLPRGELLERLGAQAVEILSLAEGQDTTLLPQFVPAVELQEEAAWEEPCSATESLLFALRGLVARLASRMQARGLVAHRLELTLQLDPSVARLRGVPEVQQWVCHLPFPLRLEEELLGVLRAKLEAEKLPAPCRGLCLKLTEQGQWQPAQLRLGHPSSSLAPLLEASLVLPTLLGELEAELGKNGVGCLRLCDAHEPESQSTLGPVTSVASPPGEGRNRGREAPAQRALTRPSGGYELPRGTERAGLLRPKGEPRRTGVRQVEKELQRELMPPTRLLPHPLRQAGAWVPGAMVSLGRELYCVEQVQFLHRVEAQRWWRGASCGRDYLRLVLSSETSPPCQLEALGFVEHLTGEPYLCGFMD